MQLQIIIRESHFIVEKFVSVSRSVGKGFTPNCFSMPMLNEIPLSLGEFTGDVSSGGSCNVGVLTYTPHNVTHVETSSHILAKGGIDVADIPLQNLYGLLYLVDLSDKPYLDNDLLYPEIEILSDLPFLNGLAIKTTASVLEPNFDFSGSGIPALNPAFTKELSSRFPHIRTLILDLPSTDIESDGGKLLAHRNFFKIPHHCTEYEDLEKKAIVELAYFGELSGGLYYFSMTPPTIKTNAAHTGIWLAPVHQV